MAEDEKEGREGTTLRGASGGEEDIRRSCSPALPVSEDVWDDGVKGGGKVHNQYSGIRVNVLQNTVQSYVDPQNK